MPRIVASSHDYPGSLLDVRHPPGGPHEVQRNLSLVAAAGFAVPEGDAARLAVRRPLPEPPAEVAALSAGYVVRPPGGVGARAEHLARPSRRDRGRPRRCRSRRRRHRSRGVRVRPPPRRRAHRRCRSRGRPARPDVAAGAGIGAGRRGAAWSPGTPAPLISPRPWGRRSSASSPRWCRRPRWRPWGVPTELLGDQHAPCAGSRARACPVSGHPCVDGVTDAEVVEAVHRVARTEVAA